MIHDTQRFTRCSSTEYTTCESKLEGNGQMVGAVQLGRQELGWTRRTWWSSADKSERRQLVTQEIREAEEKSRQ